MVEQLTTFGEHCFTPKDMETESGRTMEQHMRKKRLPTAARKSCEGDLDTREAKQTMATLPNKSPGPDCLPNLLYTKCSETGWRSR